VLTHPTLAKLEALRLFGMLRALNDQLQTPECGSLSFEERLGLLVDREATHRENQRLTARLKRARLRQAAAVEDVDFRHPRGLDRVQFLSLCSCQWLQSRDNVLITGPTGVGKTYLACALAQKACREGYTAQYARTGQLLGELALARADGTYPQRLAALGRFDVLVLDDWGLVPLSDEGRRDLLEILDERYDRRSTLVASQLPVENWHEALGDPTLADAILDRLVHNAHRLALHGESLRKQRAKSREAGERTAPPAQASRDASGEEGAE
jgi:DNA replication protein DnaC